MCSGRFQGGHVPGSRPRVKSWDSACVGACTQDEPSIPVALSSFPPTRSVNVKACPIKQNCYHGVFGITVPYHLLGALQEAGIQNFTLGELPSPGSLPAASEEAKYLALKYHVEACLLSVMATARGWRHPSARGLRCNQPCPLRSWPEQLPVSVILRVISIQLSFEDGTQATLSQPA